MRKIKKRVTVDLSKYSGKGAAWLCSITIYDEDGVQEDCIISAWSNASAAKRHIKEIIREKTSRKSIKLLPGNFDEKEKPTKFIGDMTYAIAA